jgi:hypothetical protein
VIAYIKASGVKTVEITGAAPELNPLLHTVGARKLAFELRGEPFYDRETGSRWNMFGRAPTGPQKGKRLKPVDGGAHFAFACPAFHPGPEAYRTPVARAGDRMTVRDCRI